MQARIEQTATDTACPPGGVDDYTDEGRPAEFNATCTGTTADNGLYGEGIVNAAAAVAAPAPADPTARPIDGRALRRERPSPAAGRHRPAASPCGNLAATGVSGAVERGVGGPATAAQKSSMRVRTTSRLAVQNACVGDVDAEPGGELRRRLDAGRRQHVV